MYQNCLFFLVFSRWKVHREKRRNFKLWKFLQATEWHMEWWCSSWNQPTKRVQLCWPAVHWFITPPVLRRSRRATFPFQSSLRRSIRSSASVAQLHPREGDFKSNGITAPSDYFLLNLILVSLRKEASRKENLPSTVASAVVIPGAVRQTHRVAPNLLRTRHILFPKLNHL